MQAHRTSLDTIGHKVSGLIHRACVVINIYERILFGTELIY